MCQVPPSGSKLHGTEVDQNHWWPNVACSKPLHTHQVNCQKSKYKKNKTERKVQISGMWMIRKVIQYMREPNIEMLDNNDSTLKSNGFEEKELEHSQGVCWKIDIEKCNREN